MTESKIQGHEAKLEGHVKADDHKAAGKPIVEKSDNDVQQKLQSRDQMRASRFTSDRNNQFTLTSNDGKTAVSDRRELATSRQNLVSDEKAWSSLSSVRAYLKSTAQPFLPGGETVVERLARQSGVDKNSVIASVPGEGSQATDATNAKSPGKLTEHKHDGQKSEEHKHDKTKHSELSRHALGLCVLHKRSVQRFLTKLLYGRARKRRAKLAADRWATK